MSRFDSGADFFYTTSGSNFFAGTQINLTQSEMPEYPFVEYRVSDKQILRNLSGDAYCFQNYNKLGYKLHWSFLDEAKVNEFRRMTDSDPLITWYSNGVNFGTFYIAAPPTMNEVQFELFELEIDLVEA